MAVAHNLTIPLLVGNGITAAEATGIDNAEVTVAPAYEFQRDDNTVNWGAVVTYVTSEASLTIPGMVDKDADGNDVVWLIRVTFKYRNNVANGGGGSQIAFIFAAGAGVDVTYPDGIVKQDAVQPPEYGPTWAAQALEARDEAVAAAEAAELVGGTVEGLASVVVHGTNANAPRPVTLANVIWMGTVEPVNKLNYDTWLTTSEKAIEPPLNWMVNLDAAQLALLDLVSVASWTDLSGNGRHATQATSSKRPVFHVAAGSDPAFVRGDGVDDALQTAAFTAPTQPFTLITAFRMTSVESGATIQDILAGITTAGTSFIALQQRGLTSAARYEMYLGNSGNGYVPTFLAEAGKWVVMSIVANAASTVVRINGVPYALAGNPGVNTPTGLTLFAGSNGASAYSDCDIVAVKLIGGTIPNLTDHEYALMSRCGLV